VKVICKITYPNEYPELLWSTDSTFLEKDFFREQQRDFTIRKEIIWESEMASDREVNRKEVELINQFKSNDPAVGYNRWSRHKEA
jgi:hypothetical protein